MSFYTSLSGLKAAQTDLSVTANNVANVGTIGFKRSSAQFGDIFAQAPLQIANVPGQGTRLKSINQQFTQGAFQTSERSLDLAVAGQGFFITRTDDNLGSVQYTRNGSFKVTEDRFLIDQSGAFVQVLPVDAQGILTASGIEATQRLQLPLTSVNLPSGADLPALRSAYVAPNPPYAFDRFDPNSFNHSATISAYDIDGNSLSATVYYIRQTANYSPPVIPPAVPAPPTSDWEARLFIGDVEAIPAAPSTNILTFDAGGNLISPTTTIDYDPVLPAGASAPLDINLDYGAATRQAPSPFTVKSFTQNGYAAGQLDNVTVDSYGLVQAAFSNGETRALGMVALANFDNPEGLRQLGDAKWAATGKSGAPLVGTPNREGYGQIQSGALEQANVDITTELVQLITAQRNFSANSKALEAANEITRTIINLRT
jgi:flagellar hook protein FlgE